ncbi:MAG: PstS family phosphate ABC transporter substrate-binding protein [Vampirovibrio sp.]|nr:PstS family phosphate ABC transporter substrate-binding protein [Vampirovibrio sp.]
MRNLFSVSRPFTTLVVLVSVLSLAAVFLQGCGRRPQGSLSSQLGSMVTIKGSDTMVHLVSIWAEEFMDANPTLQVSVTGGGSGTGIAALINQTTDVAASSRDIKEKEMTIAAERGVQPQEIAVARDGIAVVVNPDNPVTELTMAQLHDLFTGAVKNWKELGGPDKPVLIYSRESSSGTFIFFRETVLNNKDYAPKSRLLPATSTIMEAVSSDLGGIGYVGLGFAKEAKDRVKVVNVKADDASPAITPSEDTVKSGEYAIARPLFFYVSQPVTAPAPEGEDVQADADGVSPQGTQPVVGKPSVNQFIEFCLSEAGQKVVEETGYVSIR